MKKSLIESINNCWEKSNKFGELADIAYDSWQAKDGGFTEEDYKYYIKRSAYYYGKAVAYSDALETLGMVVVFRENEGFYGRYHAFN